MKRTASAWTVSQEERMKLAQLAIVGAVSRMLPVDPVRADGKTRCRSATLPASSG